MKTEVYSWRVGAKKKADLEAESRREGTSLAKLLDEITTNWLNERQNGHEDEEAEQAKLRKRVLATVGTIHSGDPSLATKVREVVQERVSRKHSQESNASRRTD
jgi:hypothetical protein